MNPTALKRQWDRALAIVAAVAGTVVLVHGWVEVSGTGLVTQQIPYLASEGVGGILAWGVAFTFWLSADLRDEWAKLDDIYRAVAAGGSLPQTARGTSDGLPLTVEEVAGSKHGHGLRTTFRRPLESAAKR